MPTATALPLLITTLLGLLPDFTASAKFLFGRPGGSGKKMKSDHAANLRAVLMVLARGCALQYDGLICHFEDGWVRPLTIPEIAVITGLNEKTIDRCLAELEAMGLLESRQIKRRNPTTGRLEVSGGLRKFTKKFWLAVGLWRLFQKGLDWAKRHGKRKFLLPFKGISVKARAVATKVGDLVKPFLAGLDPDAARIKFPSDKLLTIFHKT